jgi:hypothetical protein
MTRDWITSPSPRDPIPHHDHDRERPYWADEDESAFAEYPGEQTRPDIEPEPFTCRRQCECTHVATVGLFCSNCDPSGRFQ